MNPIFIHGCGAISPAGWGMPFLQKAVAAQVALPVTELARPGWTKPLPVRPVPPPVPRPAFLAHPRLRRASILSQHTVGAALEALGSDAARIQNGERRLGIVVALMPGCVTYSRRFYEEVMNNPAVASPLLFPETVFNAPGSHLAAYLNATAVSYTLVGDESSFLQGLAIAAGWLDDGRVDGALVIGAEELDWIIADAAHLFDRRTPQAGGAGALYLRATPPPVTGPHLSLAAITDAFSFHDRGGRAAAATAVRQQLGARAGELLSLSGIGNPVMDAAELHTWEDWTGARQVLGPILGSAFTASAAWQCAAAGATLGAGGFAAANVSIVGTNAQAIGVRFETLN